MLASRRKHLERLGERKCDGRIRVKILQFHRGPTGRVFEDFVDMLLKRLCLFLLSF